MRPALLVLLAACASAPVAPPPSPAAEVASLLAGAFTSEAQAAADADYANVHLHMVRIWPERADGPWLYVEQAMAAKLDAPYRQRVYRLVAEADGAVTSRVFELPDPAARAGAWRTPEVFAALTPEVLVPREGCAIRLVRTSGGWAGSTSADACASNHRGAAYATSEVRLTADTLESWDRGFDAEGKQVWGAEKGPYLFRRAP